MSEPYSTGMAPANHIQVAASWLATAAQTDEVVPAAQPPMSAFLRQLRIPSL